MRLYQIILCILTSTIITEVSSRSFPEAYEDYEVDVPGIKKARSVNTENSEVENFTATNETSPLSQDLEDEYEYEYYEMDDPVQQDDISKRNCNTTKTSSVSQGHVDVPLSNEDLDENNVANTDETSESQLNNENHSRLEPGKQGLRSETDFVDDNTLNSDEKQTNSKIQRNENDHKEKNHISQSAREKVIENSTDITTNNTHAREMQKIVNDLQNWGLKTANNIANMTKTFLRKKEDLVNAGLNTLFQGRSMFSNLLNPFRFLTKREVSIHDNTETLQTDKSENSNRIKRSSGETAQPPKLEELQTQSSSNTSDSDVIQKTTIYAEETQQNLNYNNTVNNKSPHTRVSERKMYKRLRGIRNFIMKDVIPVGTKYVYVPSNLTIVRGSSDFNYSVPHDLDELMEHLTPVITKNVYGKVIKRRKIKRHHHEDTNENENISQRKKGKPKNDTIPIENGEVPIVKQMEAEMTTKNISVKTNQINRSLNVAHTININVQLILNDETKKNNSVKLTLHNK